MNPGRGHLLMWFLLSTGLAGIGGAAGSVAGNLGGRTWLFIGGLGGGVLCAIASARIAVWRGWVPARRFRTAAAGAVIGFLLAASIAVNTLSSPVGPVTSTALIGVGAVAGVLYGNGKT